MISRVHVVPYISTDVLLMYGTTCTLLIIKTKLATSNLAAMQLANSIENKVEDQSGKQKNLLDRAALAEGR